VLALAASSTLLSALDLTSAHIQAASGPSKLEAKAVQILVEEVEKRSQVRLPIVANGSGPAIVITRGRGPAEGYSISIAGDRVSISGNDARGVLFGAGRLLREMHMTKGKVSIADSFSVTTAPKYPLRGHQLGYRPKTNAYDAWSVPIWDQYMRDLVVFGTNAIELIPPRSDDDADSPHFPLPPIEMMAEMSRIANEYGLDVSIWYPAMDRDYSNPKTIEFALEEWGEVFRKVPRIDAVFVPGGDPGHTQPKYLLALLEKQTANLRRFHPKAGMWVSPQSFSKEWMDEFYGLLAKEPAWLSGVVFGPQIRGSIEELRERTPKRYPVRFYPDITHSLHAEFPVPDWDSAFAITEGRETINPRPLGEASIFHRYQHFADGFVSYSEGCNDDVNKFLWSGLLWDPQTPVKEILADYSRFFIGEDLGDGFSAGLLALERNWHGPLETNAGVDVTLAQFRQMERQATPQQKLNWRFQMALYRAYYDGFLRSRLLAESQQEERAMAALTQSKRTGSASAMDRAVGILEADVLTPLAREYRARVFELAEALFQSIHMQLSVERYRAIGLSRGANLDAIDFALNNRVWLENRFGAIRAMDSEAARLKAIDEILNWTNPGPGGYYDDLGNPAQEPHLVLGEPYAKDPDFLKSPMTSFGEAPQSGWRVSWYTDAETLGEEPLRVRYNELDRGARYKVRVVYGGDMRQVPIRLTANGVEVHPFRTKPAKPEPLEFDLPRAAARNGSVTLEWTRPPGLGGNGRGTQVSEVWLIKAP